MTRRTLVPRLTALPPLAAGLLAVSLPTQQVADAAFSARVTAPAYRPAAGTWELPTPSTPRNAPEPG